MNRREFEKHLRTNGCNLHHHGAKHDMWLNSANGQKAAVPRHKSIKKPLVRGVCKKLDISLPDGF